jgi:hypothetical protein
MICSLVCAISRGSSTAVIARGSAACRNVLLMAVTDSARAPIGALYVAASKHPRRRCIFEDAHDVSRLVRLRSEIVTDQFCEATRGSARSEVAARALAGRAARAWKSVHPKKVIEVTKRAQVEASDRRSRPRAILHPDGDRPSTFTITTTTTTTTEGTSARVVQRC